jgi:penicillin-insensitive murein DD-endopeptidase
MKMPLKKTLAFAAAALIAVSDFSMAIASDSRPAKQVFGTISSGSSQTPEAIGFYSKGCQSGAVQMPYDGPTWQVMRLSRNRR